MAAFVDQLSETEDWPTPSAAKAGAVNNHAGSAQTADRDPMPSGLADHVARSGRLALLTRVVEAEVLPRLALAHDAGAAAIPPPALRLCETTNDAATEELVRLLLAREAVDAVAFVELLRARGATPEALFLGVISQSARVLGEMWEDDRCDFTQVTIGTGRLQQIVRALSPRFQAGAIRRAQPESVLLLPAPGEQHTFGLVLLGEFFSRAGWHVDGGPAMAARKASELVHSAWFDIVGFSVGADGRLEQLAQAIRAVRHSSRNRDIGIMVGGPLYIAQPALAARVGADTGAIDAASAVQQASGLLCLRAAAH